MVFLKVYEMIYFGLSHGNNYVYRSFSLFVGNDITFYSLSVNSHGSNSLLYAPGILYFNPVGAAPEASGQGEIAEALRYTGVNGKSLVGRIESKNVLGNIDKGPCCGSGQPAVLCFSVEGSILPGNHLGVNIGLCPVDFTDFLGVSGTGLFINFKGAAASADNSFRDGNPGVIVAEDTGIFLVSGGIGGNLAKFQMVSGIGGL